MSRTPPSPTSNADEGSGTDNAWPTAFRNSCCPVSVRSITPASVTPDPVRFPASSVEQHAIAGEHHVAAYDRTRGPLGDRHAGRPLLGSPQ